LKYTAIDPYIIILGNNLLKLFLTTNIIQSLFLRLILLEVDHVDEEHGAHESRFLSGSRAVGEVQRIVLSVTALFESRPQIRDLRGLLLRALLTHEVGEWRIGLPDVKGDGAATALCAATLNGGKAITAACVWSNAVPAFSVRAQNVVLGHAQVFVANVLGLTQRLPIVVHGLQIREIAAARNAQGASVALGDPTRNAVCAFFLMGEHGV